MSESELVKELREKSVISHQLLVMTGSMGDMTGHVFVRIPETDEFLARCRNGTDVSPAYVHPGALKRVKLDGSAAEDLGDYRMAPERHIATAVMTARPDVGCVIHAHPPAQVLCSITGVELRPIVGAQNIGGSLAVLGGVPVYPRSILISDHDIGNTMLSFMGARDILLLAAHGNVVAGRTVEEATVRAIQLENLARMLWQVAAAGMKAPDLSPQDIEYFTSFSRSNATTDGSNMFWQYYKQMLENGQRIPRESTVLPMTHI